MTTRPENQQGQFDEPIDVKSQYSAVALGEKPCAPLPPLGLELALHAVRAAGDIAGRLLGLDDAMAHDAQSRLVAAIGHRVYVEVALAAAVEHGAPGLPNSITGLVPSWAKTAQAYRLARNGGVALARYGLSEQWIVDEADRVSAAEKMPSLTDAELHAHVALLTDTFIDSAVVVINAALARGGVLAKRVAFIMDALSGRPPTAADGPPGRSQRIRDATTAIAGQLHSALQEKGSRLTANGVLEIAADVWLLTLDEIAYPPADTVETVAPRRRQHEALISTDMPSEIAGTGSAGSVP